MSPVVSPAPLERPSTGYLSVFCPCLRAINLFARHPLSTLGHYFSDTLCRRLSDVSLYRWYWPWRPHATTRAYRRPTRRHPRRRCLLLPPPHLSRIWYPLRLCNCPPLYQRTTRSSVFCFTRVEHRNVFYFHSWMTQFSLLRVTTNAVASAPARRRSRPAYLSHSRHDFPLVPHDVRKPPRSADVARSRHTSSRCGAHLTP